MNWDSGRADGASQCVELMGCFSALEVQQAAAKVCTALARTGAATCAILLDSDIGSMLQQHIKEREASLSMFENAAVLLAALADSSGEVRLPPMCGTGTGDLGQPLILANDPGHPTI